MITQEKFDAAYAKICQLRAEATKVRREFWHAREHNPTPHRAYGQEKGLSQALAILEEADREPCESWPE